MNSLKLRIADKDDIDVLVKALVLSDIDEIENIETSEIEECKKRIFQEINGHFLNSSTYIIELDLEKIGRLRLVETDNELFIAGIQILPNYRKIGIGTKVLNLLIKQVLITQKSLRLEVQKNNEKAKSLYKRLGFVVESEQEDDYIMIKIY
jgi:ribosomal protein S18 acetylase RimI-like enzyme